MKQIMIIKLFVRLCKDLKQCFRELFSQNKNKKNKTFKNPWQLQQKPKVDGDLS